MADRTPTNGKNGKKEKNPRLALIDRQIKRIAQIDTVLLTCRQGALNHAWHLVQPDFDTGIRGAKAVAQQCERCLTIKRYVVSIRYGEVLDGPTYEYPTGYKIKKERGETGRVISSQAVRAEFAKRDVEVRPMVVIRDET